MADLEERVRKLERWSAEHRGRNDEKWDNQDAYNMATNVSVAGLREMIETKFAAIFSRLGKLEAKIALFAAVAAAGGTAAAKYLLP